MSPYHRVLHSGIAALVVLTSASAHAFDDREFCVAVQQLAVAADQDVGQWTDRVTRNAGIAIRCERKTVEFKRFTYSPSSSMDAKWQARKAEDWNLTQCARVLWADAVRNGWAIVLDVTAADGGHVALTARCN
jgi:hypothetical protein